MLRRTANAVFAAGMYVFPGGRVDDVDHAAELEPYCDGLDDAAASARAGHRQGRAGLLGRRRARVLRGGGLLLARRRRRRRRWCIDEADRVAVHGGELSMDELCRRDDLVLDLVGDPLRRPLGHAGRRGAAPLRHPLLPRRRARTTRRACTTTPRWSHSMWVRPADAVAAGRGRRAADDAADDRQPALRRRAAATSTLRSPSPTPSATPPLIQPKLRRDADGSPASVSLPGDPDYDDARDRARRRRAPYVGADVSVARTVHRRSTAEQRAEQPAMSAVGGRRARPRRAERRWLGTRRRPRRRRRAPPGARRRRRPTRPARAAPGRAAARRSRRPARRRRRRRTAA